MPFPVVPYLPPPQMASAPASEHSIPCADMPGAEDQKLLQGEELPEPGAAWGKNSCKYKVFPVPELDVNVMPNRLPGSWPVITSPLDYFVGEVLRPASMEQETQSAETDKKRQHVYNTMFHVPWRCELLIVVGFFVCLDSFLSLLTVMPVRIILFLWRLLAKRRQFRRLRADELSDLGSLFVLVAGVALLQKTDISYIYHMIRSQATIKLYVVYNVLEIFDKLLQSFGSDVLQVVLNSAENVATCPSAALMSETLRFALDQCIAIVSFVIHSFIILAQSITVSAAIRAHNNALLTLLISNNFAEIKSNVFKKLAKDNLHKLAFLDTVERFHIVAHLFFVLAQNLLAANEPWLHAFAWVIRVLIPLYAAYLPGDILSRLLVILLFGFLTCVLLITLKILVALGLLKHASWYVMRHRRKEKLLHLD